VQEGGTVSGRQAAHSPAGVPRWRAAEARVAELEAALYAILRVTDGGDHRTEVGREAWESVTPARKIAREVLGLPLMGNMPQRDGCCDVPSGIGARHDCPPRVEVGALLSSNDPEPPVGTVVTDTHARHWHRAELDQGEDTRKQWVGDDDAASWTKVAGNYGPVRVLAVGRVEGVLVAGQWAPKGSIAYAAAMAQRRSGETW
jgi:hypothetical protein